MSVLIQVVTNSQGSSVGLAAGQNYPALAAKYLGPQYDVRSLVVSGWTLSDVVNNLEDNVLSLKPDIAIFQIGIVEAAQRILSNREKAFLSILPFGRILTAAMHRHRATVLTWRKRLGIGSRVVPPDEFRRLLELLSEKLQSYGIPFLLVPIPLFPDAGESLAHPLINEDIALYNAMLSRFGCLDIDRVPEISYFQNGTVHFSAKGHDWLAKALVAGIQRFAAVTA
ncbi:MAG: SGNH/GDSL hydrolase family protein [Pseudolabrys sp.]|nr:SGNH/GDSL hydrolase family protein [Pseudolabrys sp.]MDP2295569.1 SGNH/GDSL hydrolase family protein [Pseudolabrys sp.]